MIDQYPSPNGVLTSLIWRKTMSGGETSLSGYDNASQALSYTPGQEQVYLNGILLVRGDDYTATNGTSITGLSALAASDFIQVNCYNNFSVATLPTSGLVGEISNSQITSLATSKLTGTIANNQLANSSITINGSAVSLGGSTTIAGGSAQDDAPTSPTEGQLWLDTNGTLATTSFLETSTAASTYTAKSTLTTTGDIYYASATSTPARLGIGSSGQVLSVSGGVPAWTTLSAGAVLQVQSSNNTTSQSVTATSYQDITGLSVNITPSSSSSKVLIIMGAEVGLAVGGSDRCQTSYQLLRGATSLDERTYQHIGDDNEVYESNYEGIIYMDTPATTSQLTYKIQGKVGNGTQSWPDRAYIIAMEIA